MPNAPLTNDMGGRIVKLLIGVMVLLVIVVGYVYYQSVHGRRELAKSERIARDGLQANQHDGCVRGKQDRKAYIRRDTAVLAAFKDTDRRNPDPLTQARINAEAEIQATIDDLKTRLRITCVPLP